MIGFMGCGKSTIAPLLAQKLKRACFDTDEWIVTDSGMQIPEIFASRGEGWFRNKEKQCINLVAQMRKLVVAVGGGAVLDAENWLLFKKTGVTIHLKYSPEHIWERVRQDKNRPLLNVGSENKLDRIRQLLAQRESFYQMADIILNFNEHESAQQVTQQILRKLENLV